MGFLSENARFADILGEHEIAFIGPRAEHIRMMGDKIEAKRTVARLGIPCVPGSTGAIVNEDEAQKIAAEIGYPILVKAAAGGGGRGMKVAKGPGDLADAIGAARLEARAAFGEDAVYLEKYLSKPRHIEVQVHWRRTRSRHTSRRTRLLRAEAPPEGLGGGPLARAKRGTARRDRRRSWPGRWPSSAISAPERSSSCTRMESSTSSR